MFRVPGTFGDEVVLRSIDWLEDFPWRQDNGLVPTKDKYEVNINVKGFAPEDIKVKILMDGFLVVEASHEEKRDDHGYISKKLLRRHPLPEECLLNKVESKLSADGVLTVVAPRKLPVKNNTVIPVMMEGTQIKSKL